MPAPLIIRIVGDALSYLRAAEQTIAANLKINESNAKVGESFGRASADAKRSADIQIAAAVKAHNAMLANVVALREAASAAPVGSREQIAATNLANVAQLRLARSTAVTSAESEKLSAGAKNAERDVGKLTRGLLAGSGAASAMGRSLAFASGSFIGIAAVSSAIREAVAGADELDKANRSIGVVLARNNQQAGVTVAALDRWAKAQENLGVSQTEALTGLRETVVLTGSATKGMLAYRIGLELSRAENIDLDSALRIAGKAIQGQTTSLTRYGIILPKTTNAQQIFNAFQERFAKQAETNTSAFDRLRASYSNVATSVGTALLPVFEKYASSLSDWLAKTRNQKKLTDDVVEGFHALSSVASGLVSVVRVLDRVTGSFTHTLELLAAFKFASLITGWTTNLETLATKWGLVTAAATEAGAAERGALGTGAIAASGGTTHAVASAETAVSSAAGGVGIAAALSKLLGRGGTSDVVTRIGQYTKAADASGAAAVGATSKFAMLSKGLGEFALVASSPQVISAAFKQENKARGFLTDHLGRTGSILSDILLPTSVKDFTGVSLFDDIFHGGSKQNPIPVFISPQLEKLGGNPVPPAFQIPGFSGPRPASGPFGIAKPFTQLATFQLNATEELQQAQAALTRGTADDAAAAKKVIARVRRLIDEGRLHGQGLIQALQAEASALGTVWSAEDAAAQKRAQAAQAAAARLQKQIENEIDPIRLEVALSRAQALGQPFVGILKQMRASAEKALQSGKLTLQQQKEAWDQIAQLNQQIQSALSSASVTFTAPAKLQLALAKDAALGIDQTKDLLKLKAAILKFIATHKKNIQAETDAYNQLFQVNQQLGQTAQSALGLFKQASTRALTAGLGLTAAQRKALRARLSQLGPGGTLPGQGTGAFGVVIGDNGRAIHVHTTVNLDGKKVAQNTTRHQQRRRRRNSTQRRGPNAGVPVSG